MCSRVNLGAHFQIPSIHSTHTIDTITLLIPICSFSLFHRVCPCCSFALISLLVYCLFLRAYKSFCFYFHSFVLTITQKKPLSVLLIFSHPFLWVFPCRTNKIRMSSPLYMPVCKEHILRKKWVFENCGGFRCCNPPTDCSLKWNQIGYKMQCRFISAAKLFESNDTSDAWESENKLRNLTRKSSLCRKHKIDLTENFD